MNQYTLPLQRPQLFDSDNQKRANYQILRFQMASDDFGQALQDWLDETVGRDYSDVWGTPDTSLNPLSASTRQLTTPGLYGRPPTRRGPDNGELVGPRGAMRRYWPRMQSIQYFTVAMGIWFQTIDIDRRGVLRYRSVKPFDVVVWTHPDDPMKPVRIWELRVRHISTIPGTPPTPTFCWDQWDLGSPEGAREPSYRITVALKNGQPGADVSGQFIQDMNGNLVGALEGSAYPWRYEDGEPFLPWLVHRANDDGEFWPNWRRNMHTGTLRVCTFWTYVGRSALFATGEHTIISGVDTAGIPGQEIHSGDGRMESSATPLSTMRVHPSMITFVPPAQGQNLQSVRIAAGVNLPTLSNFANFYQTLLSQGDGLNQPDASRRVANPTSGAALEISQQSRREFSAQVRPIFMETDLEAIEKSARIRTIAGIPTPAPEAVPYTVEYHTIPLTAQEQNDLRVELDWESEAGLLGPVEKYLRIHPGVDYATAREAVIAAAVEAGRLELDIQATLAEVNASSPEEAATTDPEPEPETLEPAKAALAAGQVTQLQNIQNTVRDGKMPVGAAKALVRVAFPVLSEEEIGALLDELEDFEPEVSASPISGVRPPEMTPGVNPAEGGEFETPEDDDEAPEPDENTPEEEG